MTTLAANLPNCTHSPSPLTDRTGILAQAHRIKIDSPAIRVGIIRFINSVLRESGFWLLVVLALGLIGALATFNPADPAWTHTATVARLHNLGGAAGAWFADITLYFFGYPAYLLPLGLAFSGWRLFKCGGLLDLDGEIVVFRALGFVVALATACGLATLHLRVMPGAVPDMGTAGGLVGVHVSQFLIRAFGFTGGHLFMAALLLAGVMLATGASWLTILDGVGSVTLKLLDGVGGLALVPLRWLGPAAKARVADEPTEAAAVTVAPEVTQNPGAESVKKTALERLTSALRTATERSLAWRRSHRTVAKAETAVPSVPLEVESPPVIALEEATVLPGGRPSRIEPVLNWPMAESESPLIVAAVVSRLVGEAVLEAPYLDMLTLVPVMPPPAPVVLPPVSPVPPVPAIPSVQTPWQPGGGFAVAAPPVAVMARRVTLPIPPILHPLPPLDLLDPPPPRTVGYSAEALQDLSRQVEIKLKSFGIDVKVVAIEPGPVITRFELDPTPGVEVSQISNLAKDLARSLLVISVRVVESIPGKSTIGLEIPNRQREIVYLREVLESPVYRQSASPLTLTLGKDISGNPVVANLNKMPHLLIAGTTGSGKSVAINAMLLSLLYKAPPSEMRLILVDLKMLELSIYEDIPHLLTPVVTDMKAATNALRWCVSEMERRYWLMAKLKVRNIAGFNRKVLDAQAVGEGLTDPFWKPERLGMPGEIPFLPPLPFIVVVINELADLMIVGTNVEELIAGLAQKAQAAGIHLILVTQRPSVDVITGLIKANIPTRMAFQVSSRVDSRTILDQMGAEQLLGYGDMLYLPPGTGLPQRVHSAFVDNHEVNRVVDYLRQTGAPDYIDQVLAEPRNKGDAGDLL
ncbi:MAG: DNA translocase FtsK [Candidatus Competibacteraceae bacterium]